MTDDTPRIRVVYRHDSGTGTWTATIPALPGYKTSGDIAGPSLREVHAAIIAHLNATYPNGYQHTEHLAT